jgi:TPR repeat protein
MYGDSARLDIATMNLNKGRYEAAFEIFYDLATNDLDQEAQFALTKMCFDGHLDAEQISKLFAWVNSNSSLGNGYAHFNVGLMHERGMGEIKQSYKTAIEYYEKAIKEEVLDAYCNLGNIYALGLGEAQGIKRDTPKAVSYLAKGAKEGSRQAAYTLGCLYEKGEYIPQDHKKACYYLVLATLAGHEQAHRVLIMFQHANKGNFNLEFDAAEAQYGKIQNMRRLYKCL